MEKAASLEDTWEMLRPVLRTAMQDFPGLRGNLQQLLAETAGQMKHSDRSYALIPELHAFRKTLKQESKDALDEIVLKSTGSKGGKLAKAGYYIGREQYRYLC